MAGRLEQPKVDDEIYLSRGDEVLSARRLLTGDVLADIIIPGVATDLGLGMIVTHPCSMVTDGVNLIPSLHVAKVEPSDVTPWPSCPRDRMPIPNLDHGTFHVVRFDLIGMITTSDLEAARRLATLSVRGVNLLQQRLIWYFTRFEVPTAQLNQLFTPVFEEVDLQEIWVEAATEAGVTTVDAVSTFHQWIRADDGTGTRRQDRLKDAQARPAIRRALQTEVANQFKN